MFRIGISKRFIGGMDHYVGFKSMSRNTFGRNKKIFPKIEQPTTPIYVAQSIGLHTLAKPLAFTICFSAGTFACATLWQYEDMRKKARQFRSRFGNNSRHNQNIISRELSFWWHRLTEGQKIVFVIAALNACVFVMWRVPSLQPFMLKFFTACPSSKRNCLPMLLSTFSHHSFFHMVTNMYVLYSFSSGSVAFFGKEQFVALYLSSGVIASFASYCFKIATKSYGVSLGASGALMAILSSTCLQFPQTQLAIVFFPFFTVSAGKAIKFIMAADFVGLIAKWKVFDHAAHLGGACFGVFYLYYGRDYIWGKRERLIVWWHNIREKFK